MKKFLVVLTILVLVAGFAFADSKISGKVTAAYTFDFDAKTIGYAVKGNNAELKWTWNSHTVGPYEASGKPYATVTVAVTMESKIGKDAVAAWKFSDYTTGDLWADLTIKVALKEAKIVGEDWEIDLLKAQLFGEYAKSAWDMAYNTKDDAYNAAYTYDNTHGGKANGVTVTYKDVKVGIGAGSPGEGLYDLDISAESPEFKFDGGSAQAAAIIGTKKLLGTTDPIFNFSVSAKANYTVDKLSASVAFDGEYVSEEFNFDTALKVAYEPATLDFYYASALKATYMPAYEKYMSVKVTVDVAKIAENVPVVAYVGMQDVLDKNDSRELVVGANYKTENLTAEASFALELSDDKDLVVGGTAKATKLVEGFGLEGGVDYYGYGENTSMFAAMVGANYTAEKYSASADVAVVKLATESTLYLGFKATVESDKIVENAKLFTTLVIDKNAAVALYEFADLVRTSTDLKDFGTVTIPGTRLTLGCEIAF